MKYGFLPSPDSTCVPSGRDTHQYPSEASETGSVEYRQFSDDSLPTQSKLPTKVVATASLLAVAAAAAAGACWAAGFWPKAAPRIWDPDLRLEFSGEPLAKSVIRKFDAYNMARGGRDDDATFKANVLNYLAPDLLYESVGFGTWSTPAGWARGEEYSYGMAFPETIFTQMLFFGDRRVSTTTTYGSALWGGKLFGIKAPHQWVTLRITDFYNIREESPGHGRVTYNFMIIDWVDTLRQIGRRMLPPAPLPEGIVLPPSANDGVPAPLSVLCKAEKRDAKAARVVVEATLQQDWAGAGRATVEHWYDDLTYYGPGGIGLAQNASAYEEHVLRPFRAAFGGRAVVVDLSACEGNYCGVFGRLKGRGVGPWLGLPTTGREVSFRFANHYRVVGGKVQEGWTIFDFPGLFKQIGLDFYNIAASGGRV